MTVVTVKRHGKGIVSINAAGHTGYGARGEDIVCAAISAIIQTAGLGIIQVADVKARVRTEDGAYNISLPASPGKNAAIRAEAILETMLIGLRDIESGYPEYIKIIEITGA